MLPEMEIESDADGPFLISPASSDRSKTASNNGQDSNPQDSVVDTEMHELSDTHSQINLGSSTLQDSTRSSEEDHFETVQQPPTKSKGNPSRGKGKMIMVGGNLVAGGGSGMGTSSRSRNESGRIPAPRHGLLANDWAVDQHDGPKGMKLLDEELIRKYDFGDPFLEIYEARHQNGQSSAQVQPSSHLDDNLSTLPLDVGLPTATSAPLTAPEGIALNTPAASPS